MIKRTTATLSVVTALSFGALSAAAAMANEAPTSSFTESAAPAGQSSAPATQAPAPIESATPAPVATPGTVAANVPDDQLRKFVASAQEVAVVSQQYSKQLEGVQDRAEQQKVVEQANQEMSQIIQNNGLTIQEFNAISDAVDSDPALQQRAQQMVQ